MGKVEFEGEYLPRIIGGRGHCGAISMGKVSAVKFDLPQTLPGPSPFTPGPLPFTLEAFRACIPAPDLRSAVQRFEGCPWVVS